MLYNLCHVPIIIYSANTTVCEDIATSDGWKVGSYQGSSLPGRIQPVDFEWVGELVGRWPFPAIFGTQFSNVS